MKDWHGTKLFQPDWSDSSHSIAFSAELKNSDEFVHVIVNAYWEPLAFELPKSVRSWRRWIDTSLNSPHDIALWEDAPPITGGKYIASARSVVVLHTC